MRRSFGIAGSTRTLGTTLALSAMVFAVVLSTLCASLPSQAGLDPDNTPRWAAAFLSICTIGSNQHTDHGSGHEDHGSGGGGGDHGDGQHCAMCYAICAALAAVIATVAALLLAGNAGSHPRPVPVARLRTHNRWFSFQGRAPPLPA